MSPPTLIIIHMLTFINFTVSSHDTTDNTLNILSLVLALAFKAANAPGTLPRKVGHVVTLEMRTLLLISPMVLLGTGICGLRLLAAGGRSRIEVVLFCWAFCHPT